MYAKVIVGLNNPAMDKLFDYAVPAGTEVCRGVRVIVPFGRRNAKTEGYVISLSAETDVPADKIKNIMEVLDEEKPTFTPELLELAKWMQERYFCTFFEAIRAMLPACLWFRSQETYTMAEGDSLKEKCDRQPNVLSALMLLEDLGGRADGEALKAAVPDGDALQEALRYALNKKWSTTQSDFLRRTGDKTEKVATLAASAEEAMEYAAHRPKSAAMQRSAACFHNPGRTAVQRIIPADLLL